MQSPPETSSEEDSDMGRTVLQKYREKEKWKCARVTGDKVLHCYFLKEWQDTVLHSTPGPLEWEYFKKLM